MTREEAIEFAKEQLEIFGKDSTMYEFLEFSIKALEERPKGKWEFVQYDANPNIGNWHCTNCRGIAIAQYNFCPICGADMRG